MWVPSKLVVSAFKGAPVTLINHVVFTTSPGTVECGDIVNVVIPQAGMPKTKHLLFLVQRHTTIFGIGSDIWLCESDASGSAS